jgi:hypothetical protein
VIEFKAREPQQNQRSNRQRGYADAGREVLSGSGNGDKPDLLRPKPEGGKHLAARSDQTAAEREHEVGSVRSEPQLLRTERVYSPFAKTFLASSDEDFATGSNVGGRRLKKRLRTNQWVMPKDRTLKKH